MKGKDKEKEVYVIGIKDTPPEIKVHIFSFLGAKDLGKLSLVSKEFSDLSKEPVLWRNIFWNQNKRNRAITEGCFRDLVARGAKLITPMSFDSTEKGSTERDYSPMLLPGNGCGINAPAVLLDYNVKTGQQSVCIEYVYDNEHFALMITLQGNENENGNKNQLIFSYLGKDALKSKFNEYYQVTHVYEDGSKVVSCKDNILETITVDREKIENYERCTDSFCYGIKINKLRDYMQHSFSTLYIEEDNLFNWLTGQVFVGSGGKERMGEFSSVVLPTNTQPKKNHCVMS